MLCLPYQAFAGESDIHSDNSLRSYVTFMLLQLVHSMRCIQLPTGNRTQKVLAELQKKCQNDPSLQAVLQLTYPTCPKELKDSYEGALKEQFEMKDVC